MATGLPEKKLLAGVDLHHVSRTDYAGKPLFFGRSARSRYDDPAKNYGVLYLAEDLPTALMESVFHQHKWASDPNRNISLAELATRLVRAISLSSDLTLANLSAPGAMAAVLGLTLEALSSRDYSATQKLSAEIHAETRDDGQPRYDGIYYPSRNNFPTNCIALFDRAAHKIECFADITLIEHADWPAFAIDYKVAVVPYS